MYAAAGGASLASRQARRNIRKQNLQASATHGQADLHQQFKRKLDLLQAHHAPAHFLRDTSFTDLHSRVPSASDITEGKAAAAWSDHRRVSLAESHHHYPHRTRHADHHHVHTKWRSRNRIHDSSYGGSSSEDEDHGGLYGHQNAAANALLYVGLGTVAIGLVIAFVGTGEKGFKTVELRLIGPIMIATGLLCCLLRIFLCVCPSCCRKNVKKAKQLDPKREYYKHLPFSSRAQQVSTKTEGGVNKKKKRVSILPTVGSAESREVPRIVVPDVDSMELTRVPSSCDDLPSIGSEESLTAQDPQAKERLARLKSTLTFGDSLDAPKFPKQHNLVSRISEEDSDQLDMFPPASSPLLPPDEPMSGMGGLTRPTELVLTPSQLRDHD